MITVYLKRIKEGNTKYVFVYADNKETVLKVKINGDISTLPNKRRKVITLNCFKYNVKWL